jgi:hypothetical protein
MAMIPGSAASISSATTAECRAQLVDRGLDSDRPFLE